MAIHGCSWSISNGIVKWWELPDDPFPEENEPQTGLTDALIEPGSPVRKAKVIFDPASLAAVKLQLVILHLFSIEKVLAEEHKGLV